LTLKQRSSGAEWFRRKAADVDFNPIDIDLDDNHIGIREARRKMRIQVARPHSSHFRDILGNRRAAT
jgi:hypothetical protein